MGRLVDMIVIHCSATPNGRAVSVADIRSWHLARGFTDIGYHWVVYLDGTVHAGRPEEEMGAHALHFNEHSIGICMVGGVGAAGADPHNPGKYTAAQWIALRRLIDDIESRHPIKRICGHRDLSPDVNSDGHIEPSEWIKLCPSFDVDGWREAGMFPAALNVLEDPCSKT